MKLSEKKKLRLALDEVQLSAGGSNTWEQLIQLLQEHLPPDAMEAAVGHLEHLLNDTDPDSPASLAQDHRRPLYASDIGALRQRVVQGQIKRAADATASITKRYPNFARVRVVG